MPNLARFLPTSIEDGNYPQHPLSARGGKGYRHTRETVPFGDIDWWSALTQLLLFSPEDVLRMWHADPHDPPMIVENLRPRDCEKKNAVAAASISVVYSGTNHTLSITQVRIYLIYLCLRLTVE